MHRIPKWVIFKTSNSDPNDEKLIKINKAALNNFSVFHTPGTMKNPVNSKLNKALHRTYYLKTRLISYI